MLKKAQLTKSSCTCHPEEHTQLPSATAHGLSPHKPFAEFECNFTGSCTPEHTRNSQAPVQEAATL